MIHQMAAERIKLFSTRAAWWCLGLTAVLTLALALLAGTSPSDGQTPTIADAQAGGFLGQIVLMILAIVSVTGDHRFGTIRASYLANPRRWQVLLAKATTLVGLGLLLGTILAFASVAAVSTVFPTSDMTLSGAARWREVLGVGVAHAIGMVIAAAVASLMRHAAGAISSLLVWIFVLEPAAALLPGGDAIGSLLPFQAQAHFLGQAGGEFPYPPWFGAVYAAAFAAVLLGLAMYVAERRDAG